MREIELAIRECLHEKYGPFVSANWPRSWRLSSPMPEGLRVEMHPLVYRRFVQDQSMWDISSITRDPLEVLAERWGVPVKINPEMDLGTWRLVIVTEEVLTGGGLPDAPA